MNTKMLRSVACGAIYSELLEIQVDESNEKATPDLVLKHLQELLGVEQLNRLRAVAIARATADLEKEGPIESDFAETTRCLPTIPTSSHQQDTMTLRKKSCGLKSLPSRCETSPTLQLRNTWRVKLKSGFRRRTETSAASSGFAG
jgi:hypothetical protein